MGAAIVVRFAKMVRAARVGPWLGWRGCSDGGQGGRSYISVLYLVTFYNNFFVVFHHFALLTILGLFRFIDI